MNYPFQWLARSAKEQPDQIAIIYHDQDNNQKSLTYKEFYQAVCQLTMQLQQQYPPLTTIGVCLGRNHEYLICMYAIWMAGMIYMPFSDSHERIDIHSIESHLSIVEKKYGKAILLTRYPSLLQQIKYAINYEIFNGNNFKGEFHFNATPALYSPAYICCSSGTADKPKLILNNYEGFEDRVKGLADQLMPDNYSQHCILGFSAYDFDASLLDSMMAVYRGATFYLVPNYIKKNVYSELPKLFQLAYSQHRPITVAVLLPSVLSGIEGKGLDATQYPGLESLVTMGDICKDIWLKSWLKKIKRVFNGYGPTEATIAALLALLKENSDSEIPLGKPLPGIIIDLIDLESKLTVGTITHETSDEALLKLSQELQQKVCEIYIRGSGIGNYLHDETSDKESFIYRSQQLNNKTFISKDLACLKDGKLIFRGRLDKLIKRNGVRVNLDDIKDTFIRKMDATLLQDIFIIDIDKFIIACVLSPAHISDDVLAEKLHQCNESIDIKLRLNFFIRIDHSITNDRFKFISNAELLKNAGAKLLRKQSSQACEGPIELALANIWAEILIPHEIPQCDQAIQATDNFFDWGGTSLDISRLIAKTWKLVLKKDDQGGIPFDFSNFIYRNPILRNIANYIETYLYQAAIEHKTEGIYPPFFYVSNFGKMHDQLSNPVNIQAKIYKLIPKQLSNLTTLTSQQLYQQCDNMVEQCIRAIHSIQQIGPYQILTTQQDLNFTLALVNELKLSGMQVILNVHHSDPSIKDELALEYEKTLSKWLSEKRGIQSENIKTLFQINYLSNEEFTVKLNSDWVKQQQSLIKYKLDKLYIKQQKKIIIPESYLPYVIDGSSFNSKSKNIDEALENFYSQNNHPVLFIMGPHGIGKKTLLLKHAIALWKKHQYNQNALPIAVDLRKSTSKTPLLSALQTEGFNENDFNILKTQNIVFFVYGYGEMNRYDFPCLLNEISDFKSAKILISMPFTLTPNFLTKTWDLKKCAFITLSQLSISHIKQNETDLIFLQTLASLTNEPLPLLTPLNLQIFKEMITKKLHWTNHVEFLIMFFNYWLIHEASHHTSQQHPELSSIIDYISKLPKRLTIRPLPSKWENKQLNETEEKIYQFIKHPYFSLIKKLLIPYSENDFSLPAWLLQVVHFYNDKQLTLKIDFEHINNEMLNGTTPTYLTNLLAPHELQNIIAKNTSFVPINTGQHLSPVFFFHPLTGVSTGDYRNLAKRLGPKQPVYCFAMAKSNDSENNDSYSENLFTKVIYFANLIQKIQPTGEINLAGWSYGGLLLAFTAYILEQRGRKIGLAIIIDCSSPAAMREIPVGNRCLELLKSLPDIYNVPKSDILPDEKLITFTNQQFTEIDVWNNKQLSLTQYSDIIECMFNYAISHYVALAKLTKDNRNLEQLIKGLTNSRINLKSCYQAFDEKIMLNSTVLHIAEPGHTRGINPGHDKKAGYLWHEIVRDKKVEIKSFPERNHYDIFKDEEFIEYFCDLVAKQQTRLNIVPLENRINNYMQQFCSDKNYVKTEATLNIGTKIRLDLCKMIIDSICKNEQTFLIHGASGAGKTTFLMHILATINQLASENNLGQFLPIYAKASSSAGDIITNTLKEQGFSDHEINNDIQNRQIFLVIDGCSNSILNVNLFDFYELNKYPKLIVIFACRSNYLEKDFYKKSFAKSDGKLKEYYIPPLALRTIYEFISLHQKNNNIASNILLTDFNKITQNKPELKEEASNPMMLSMIIKILPDLMSRSDQNISSQYWTKTNIQRNFIAQTITLTINILQDKEGIPPGVNIEHALMNYYQELAFTLFEDKQIKSDNIKFFDISSDTQQLLNAPLLDIGKSGIAFIHNNYYEFFVAIKLCNKITQSQKEFEEVRKLIVNSKHNPDFENILIYLIGLLAEQPENNKYIKNIFEIILDEPNNLVGFNDHLLILRCANEAKLPGYLIEHNILGKIIQHYLMSILTESYYIEDYKRIFMNTLGSSPYIMHAFNIQELLYKTLMHAKQDKDVQIHIINIIATIKKANDDTLNYLCNLMLGSEETDLVSAIAKTMGEIGNSNPIIVQSLQSAASKNTQSRADCEEALWWLGIADTTYGKFLDEARFDETLCENDTRILKQASMVDQHYKDAPWLVRNTIGALFSWFVTHNPAGTIKFTKNLTSGLFFNWNNPYLIHDKKFDVPIIIRPLIQSFKTASVKSKIVILKNLRYLSSDRPKVKLLLFLATKDPDEKVQANAYESLIIMYPTSIDIIHQICKLLINTDSTSLESISSLLNALGHIKYIDIIVLQAIAKSFNNNFSKIEVLNAAKKLIPYNQDILIVLISALKTHDKKSINDAIFKNFPAEVCKILGNQNLTPYLAYFADEDLLKISHTNYQYLFHSTPLESLIHYLLLTRFQIFANYIIGKSLYDKHNLHIKGNSLCYYEFGNFCTHQLTNEEKLFCEKIFNSCLHGQFPYLFSKDSFADDQSKKTAAMEGIINTNIDAKLRKLPTEFNKSLESLKTHKTKSKEFSGLAELLVAGFAQTLLPAMTVVKEYRFHTKPYISAIVSEKTYNDQLIFQLITDWTTSDYCKEWLYQRHTNLLTNIEKMLSSESFAKINNFFAITILFIIKLFRLENDKLSFLNPPLEIGSLKNILLNELMLLIEAARFNNVTNVLAESSSTIEQINFFPAMNLLGAVFEPQYNNHYVLATGYHAHVNSFHDILISFIRHVDCLFILAHEINDEGAYQTHYLTCWENLNNEQLQKDTCEAKMAYLTDLLSIKNKNKAQVQSILFPQNFKEVLLPQKIHETLQLFNSELNLSKRKLNTYQLAMLFRFIFDYGKNGIELFKWLQHQIKYHAQLYINENQTSLIRPTDLADMPHDYYFDISDIETPITSNTNQEPILNLHHLIESKQDASKIKITVTDQNQILVLKNSQPCIIQYNYNNLLLLLRKQIIDGIDAHIHYLENAEIDNFEIDNDSSFFKIVRQAFVMSIPTILIINPGKYNPSLQDIHHQEISLTHIFALVISPRIINKQKPTITIIDDSIAIEFNDEKDASRKKLHFDAFALQNQPCDKFIKLMKFYEMINSQCDVDITIPTVNLNLNDRLAYFIDEITCELTQISYPLNRDTIFIQNYHLELLRTNNSVFFKNGQKILQENLPITDILVKPKLDAPQSNNKQISNIINAILSHNTLKLREIIHANPELLKHPLQEDYLIFHALCEIMNENDLEIIIAKYPLSKLCAPFAWHPTFLNRLLLNSTKEGKYELAQQCLTLGADVRIKDKSNEYTPLHYLCLTSHSSTIIFISKDPKINWSAQTIEGDTVFHFIVKSRNIDILRDWLDKPGMDIKNYQDVSARELMDQLNIQIPSLPQAIIPPPAAPKEILPPASIAKNPDNKKKKRHRLVHRYAIARSDAAPSAGNILRIEEISPVPTPAPAPAPANNSITRNWSSWFYIPTMRSIKDTAKNTYTGVMNYFYKK